MAMFMFLSSDHEPEGKALTGLPLGGLTTELRGTVVSFIFKLLFNLTF